MESGDIALQRAVALDGDEAALGTQALALSFDHFQMFCVDLGHNHGNVIRPTVRRVVGNNGALQLGITLFQSTDLFLLHINCAEAEINHRGQLFGIDICIQNDQLFRFFRHGNVQSPTTCNCFLIRLTGTAAAGGDRGQLEPGMVFHQSDKTLANHAGATDNANFVLFHNMFLLLLCYDG